MSDDDLWSRTPTSGDEPHADEPQADATAADETAPPVSDETQPLSGLGAQPEDASAAEPPAPPPPATGHVPPPVNPYGAPSEHTAPPAQNPYGATTPYPTAPPPYGQPSSQPYGQQPDPAQPYGAPYGQPGAYPPPPTNPYPQPGSFDQQPPPSPYGSPYAPAYAGGMVPDHGSATMAMVLGIIGLVGVVLCGGITLVLSPFAWAIGSRAVREIDASQGRVGGREKANAGKIMGIIGTVLLVLGVAFLALVFGLAVATSTSTSTG